MKDYASADQVTQQRLDNDDEIDLFDLINDIWAHKNWVFICVFFTLLVAGLYLFKAIPVYQAEAKVKVSTANDLIEFSRPQLQGIYNLDAAAAFASAKAALLSTGYRKEFYDLKLEQIKSVPNSYNENLSLEQNFVKFSDLFSIKASGSKDVETHVQLSLKGSDPEMVSELLNEFVEYALFRRLRDSYDTMLAKINGRIEELNYQANIMREQYMGNKARRILELKEAARIAIAVGQVTSIYHDMDIVGGQAPPLYMLGSKAIGAEIEALGSREKIAQDLIRGEDHFIAGLPGLLVEIESLQDLEVDFSKINLARIDQVAVMPISPVKPRKLLIMALALVAGLFIGLFMALIVAAYKKHKIRTANKENT